MKKIIAAALFFCAILSGTPAQTTEGKNHVDTAFDYNFSMLNYSVRGLENKSILTWRDIFLHGGQAMVKVDNLTPEFIQNIIFSAAAAWSFDGYHTDDDANNSDDVFWVADTKALTVDVDFSVTLFDAANDYLRISRRIGADFTFISFKNYEARSFYRGRYSLQSIDGLVNTYDIYKFGTYFGIGSRLVDTRLLYIDLSGRFSSSIVIAPADWIHRDVFKHPVSFVDIGWFLGGNAEFELGMKIKMLTLFTRIQASYEFSPWLNLGIQYMQDGDVAGQTLFMNLGRASFSAGFKLSF